MARHCATCDGTSPSSFLWIMGPYTHALPSLANPSVKYTWLPILTYRFSFIHTW